MARRKNHSRQTQLVLAVLSKKATEWVYGYELSKGTGLKSGTLYPILMRLHDQGLLVSDWRPPDMPGRPARHVYQLTSAGAKLAAEQAAERHAREENLVAPPLKRQRA